MPKTPPIVLTIAGFDPSSGAGITADIKTIAAHGCYGVACISALTIQSTKGVRGVVPVSGPVIREILEELAADLEFAAVHVGMLGNEEAAETVRSFLAERKLPNIVLDPILRSSSGANLLDQAGLDILLKMLPLASVITPNVDEAAELTGLPVTDRDQVRAAAQKLHQMGAKAVVVTGGHLERATDLLSVQHGRRVEQSFFELEKFDSNSTHGTGCAFSTSLACELALGTGLTDAVGLAKAYVSGAIADAYPVGRGTGPVNHFYSMRR